MAIINIEFSKCVKNKTSIYYLVSNYFPKILIEFVGTPSEIELSPADIPPHPDFPPNPKSDLEEGAFAHR
jgi:hypothetical protein